LPVLSVLSGLLVGFALGLTGGGGAILAVPLLVYGLALGPREATGVSLAAVGCTALTGCLHRLRAGHVELGVGALFALSGMAGAPLGAWAGALLPDMLLLLLFAVLMSVVAARLWLQATRRRGAGECARSSPLACRRDADGRVLWSARCVSLLAVLGFLTGILSGLFGVGGGFLIVPGLVLFSGMAMHRAIGTSLLVIALVSLSGVASHVFGGRLLPLGVTGLFVLGGVGGVWLGGRVGRRLSGPRLQQIFAGAILTVAAFIVIKTFMGTRG
jgi:uncharacterized membrane protein YfcA